MTDKRPTEEFYFAEHSIAVALGANIHGPVGSPTKTLITLRPILEQTITKWITSCLEKNNETRNLEPKLFEWQWSPLFETKPIGGPPNQPSFINAVLFVAGNQLEFVSPNEEAAMLLLDKFLNLEQQFGRRKTKQYERWGPRCLDIDFLSWGSLQVSNKDLVLPHPRIIQRDFVIIPLAEAIQKSKISSSPKRIPPQSGWPE